MACSAERVGDIGIDVGGERWIWLPSGLKWVDPEEWVAGDLEMGGDDLLALIRDVARGS